MKMADLQFKVGHLLSLGGSGSTDTPEFHAAKHARGFHKEVKILFQAAQRLYEANVSQKWELETLTQASQITEKGKECCCVCIDHFSTIYTAYSDGTIKVWKRVTHTTVFISKDTDFKKHQVIQTATGLRLICVNDDAKRLVAAIGNDMTLFTITRGATNDPQFKESLKLYGHNGPINGIIFSSIYIISASSDGYVKLWAGTTSKPAAIWSGYAGGSINCICHIHLCNYLMNAEAQRDRLNAQNAVCVGLANGGVAFLPLPLEKAELSTDTSWESLQIAKEVMGYRSSISSISIAWNFLYVGYVDGTVRCYAIVIEDQSRMFMEHSIKALKIVSLDSQQIHAGPVTGIIEAGDHMFTISHDMSIMKWKAPLNLTADTPLEFSQEHDTAMIIHAAPIITICGNNYCIVSGDDTGKVIISAPLQTCDSVSSGKCKPYIEPKVEFSFISFDFGAVYVPAQGVASVEEKILCLHNKSDVTVHIRKLSKQDSNIRCEFMKDASSCVGAGYRQKDLAGDTIPSASVSIGAGKMAYYKFTFTPTEIKKYAIKTTFLVNEGEQTMLVHVYGRGEKPILTVSGVGDNTIEFGEVYHNIKTQGIISLSNGGSRPMIVHVCDLMVQNITKKGNGDDDGNYETCFDKQIFVTPHTAYLWPGVPTNFYVYYTPKSAEEPSFSIPLQFCFNGQIAGLAQIKAKNSVTDSNETMKKREDDQNFKRMDLIRKIKEMCKDPEAELKDEGKVLDFTRNEDNKKVYEDIVRQIHFHEVLSFFFLSPFLLSNF